jgi:anti-anti-sigma factor
LRIKAISKLGALGWDSLLQDQIILYCLPLEGVYHQTHYRLNKDFLAATCIFSLMLISSCLPPVLESSHPVTSCSLEEAVEIIEIGKEKDTKVISLKGRMDAISSPAFEEKTSEWVNEGESSFLIDMGELNYMSSAGLRSILLLAKALKSKDGKVICAAPKDEVKEILRISGFSSMIPTYESVQAALEHI